MRPVSATFLEALRGPHVLSLRVQGTAPDGLVTDFAVQDGTVTLDGTVETRGRCELTVAQAHAPRRSTGPMSPYGSWVTVERGVRYGDDTTERVQLGRFRIESVDTDLAAGVVRIVGYDASRAIRDDRFLAPRTIAAGTQYTTAIQQLAQETIPALPFVVPATARTLATDAVFERERWEAIRELAVAIGCEAFVDGSGTLIVRPPPTAAGGPVWTIDAGPTGVLTEVAESMARESAYNAVVATGEALDGVAPARGVAYDTTSAIRWDGPYGHNPRFYASPLLADDAQALSAAQAILASEQGIQRSVDLSAVPNPALEPGDAVTVIYPDGLSEVHLLDTLTIPLRPTGALRASTRLTTGLAREPEAEVALLQMVGAPHRA